MIPVLLVDDDPVITSMFRARLRAFGGYRVVGVAHTGRDALAASRRLSPRLVVLDLHLPDLPGLEVARRLQGVDKIVLSGDRGSETVREAVRCGALHYLVKPVCAATLEQVLRRYAASVAQPCAGQIGQEEINAFLGLMHRDEQHAKNIAPATVQGIMRSLSGTEGDLGAEEVAARAGVSRATARRYLEHLVKVGWLESELRYGKTGRPQHRFRVRSA